MIWYQLKEEIQLYSIVSNKYTLGVSISSSQGWLPPLGRRVTKNKNKKTKSKKQNKTEKQKTKQKRTTTTTTTKQTNKDSGNEG